MNVQTITFPADYMTSGQVHTLYDVFQGGRIIRLKKTGQMYQKLDNDSETEFKYIKVNFK